MKSLVRSLLATAVVAATVFTGLVALSAPASAGLNVSGTRCSGTLKYSHALKLRNIYWSSPTASSLSYDDVTVAYARYYYEPSRHTNCAELVKASNPVGADYDGAIYLRIDLERYGSPYTTVGWDDGWYSSYAGSIRSSANYNYRIWAEVADYDNYEIRNCATCAYQGSDRDYRRSTWSSGWA